MVQVTASIRVLEGCDRSNLPLEELLASGQPAVLKGLARDWGLVRAGLRSDQEAMQYLRSFYNGKPVPYSFGEPEIAGRPFYNEDFTALNCVAKRDRLDTLLQQIDSHLQDEKPPTYYISSVPVDTCLPGFRAENDLGFGGHGI